jgi:protein-S-isoprenylcysteine O-methyltransferase Ste14
MPTTPSLAASRAYSAVQTVLLCAFAVVLLWNPGTPLFASPTAAIAGGAIALAGLVLIALGFLALRGNIQVAPHPREGAHLVTSGVYRWLRHPIYSGIALCVVGLWLREPTVEAAIAAIVVIAFLGVKRRVEERFLMAAYPAYGRYRERTLGFP